MMEKCLDIGTIQAFLDGELDFGKADAVAKHVAECDECAILLAASEEESAFAFSALEQEFNTLVPTQRLWTKINDSIEREKKSFWKPIFAFLLQPSTAAFASLLLVFAVVVSLLTMRPNAPISGIQPQEQTNSSQSNNGQTATVAQTTRDNQTRAEVESPQTMPVETNRQLANLKSDKKEYRAVKPVYINKENGSDESNLPKRIAPLRGQEILVANANENLSGEESYIKTIAALSETVNNRKDEVLNSSARFAFEKDLAMTNSAIKNMREEVRKNPKNEAAKQILRASYQNKIDLLNSVAEKNELMASVK